MRFLTCHAHSGPRALVIALTLASCSLPAIHRESAVDASDSAPPDDASRHAPDASADDASAAQQMPLAADSDAGPSADPEQDPANRNESLEAFQELVPKQHLFAEWPMPDSAPHSKNKPSYTVGEQIVIDNVTKLRWQRDLPDVYPGCTAEYVFVGRPRGPGTGCTFEEAQAYCKRPELAKQLGGGTWRVPTKIELESLIDVSRINTIDPSLDDFPVERVWSVSPIPNPDGLKLAWAVDYMEGVSFDTGRFKGGRVRCVSSANDKGGSAQSFELLRNSVRDTVTGLEWQRFPDSPTRDWNDALAYCEALDTEDGAWRLPSVKELLTLVDPSRRLPAIQAKAFPFTQSERYWTSSVYLDGRDAAYWVDFVWGGVGTVGTMRDQHFVRCVR